MKKLIIAVAVLLFLSVGAYVTFQRGDAAMTPAATPAAIIAEDQLVAEAKVVPVQSAALSLPIGGGVAEMLVAEGDQVTGGQALLRLDRAPAPTEGGPATPQPGPAAYQQPRATPRPQSPAAA